MNPTKVIVPRVPRTKAVVKGPIRCHKCQKLCRDAEHYLDHNCGAKEAVAGRTGLPELQKF